MMEAHRNDEVSALFRDMVRFSRLHHDSIVERARGMALPTLRSRQYRWTQAPEAGGEEAFDVNLDAYSALCYARENEARALDYYRDVGMQSSDIEVKRMAVEFAAEEAEHVEALDAWIARTQRPSLPFATDRRSAKLGLSVMCAAGNPGAAPQPRRWRDAQGEHIDVQGLPRPQPLVAILRLVHELGDSGTALIVHIDRDPLALYPELAELGWTAELLSSDADEVLLRLEHVR